MNLVTQVSLGRIAIGVAAVARPADVARLLTFEGGGPVYLTRLAGARDIALGAATLLAPRGARKILVGLGIAVDASDAYAGYEAYRQGAVSRGMAVLLAGPAVGAVLAGAAGLAEKPTTA